MSLDRSNQLSEFCFDDYIQLKFENLSQGYISLDKVVSYFRSCILVVCNGGNDFIIVKTRCTDPVDNTEYPKYLWRKSLPFVRRDKWCFRISPGGKLHQANRFLHKLIWEDRSMCMCSRVDYLPTMRRPLPERFRYVNTYNLFIPFPWEYLENYTDEQKASDQRVVQPILDHIHQYFCRNDNQAFAYFVGYLAHLIQKPQEKPQISINIISPTSLGKDLICHDLMSGVLGKWNTLHIDASMGRRLKDLNSEGKLLIYLSELHAKLSNFTYYATLKGHFKDITTTVDLPYCDYVLSNNARFMGTGSKRVCWYVNPDDRRFLLLQENEPIPDHEYFTSLAELVHDPRTHEAMFNYLSHSDISDFHVWSTPVSEEWHQIHKREFDEHYPY